MDSKKELVASVALVRHEHVPGGAGHAFVVAFRGTDTTYNWLQNANAIVAFACPLADSNLVFGIHAGFCATYMGGADMIADGLRDLMERHRHAGSADWPLWITGHSLGGALAQLSAYDLHRRGFPVSGLMTFASPRAFNALMAPYVERAGFEMWAVVAEGDAVNLLPDVLTYVRSHWQRSTQQNYEHGNGASYKPSSS